MTKSNRKQRQQPERESPNRDPWNTFEVFQNQSHQNNQWNYSEELFRYIEKPDEQMSRWMQLADNVIAQNIQEETITETTKSLTSMLQRTFTMFSDTATLWGEWLSDPDNLSKAALHAKKQSNPNEVNEPLNRTENDFLIAVSSRAFARVAVNVYAPFNHGELLITPFCKIPTNEIFPGLKADISNNEPPYDLEISITDNTPEGTYHSTIVHSEYNTPVANISVIVGIKKAGL